MVRLFPIFVVVFCGLVYAQQTPEEAVPKPFLPELKYPTADLFVASLNIMDFKGADNTGRNDMAPLIRTLLKRLEGSSARDGGVGNGGVLFLPEGKYLLESNIIVPKGVTIRGEWQKPIRGKPIQGTIIVTDFGRGEETTEKSLFILEPAAAVKDLAIWYPKQMADRIVPYPPAIGFGAPRYFGNEYCVAQNITFVNAYNGAVLIASGGAPNMFGLYGTPLKRGIEIDFIAEVGRVEGVDFSPEYWIGSGLPDAPRRPDVFRNWLRNNGTAVVMRRNDWSYVSNLTADGYQIGFHLVASMKEPDAKPNGQNYLLRFTDCRTALYAEDQASVGVMFHDVRVEDCDYGLFVPKNASGTLQLTHWHIEAKKFAVGIDTNCSTHILFGQSKIVSGKMEAFGGSLVFLDCDIDTAKPQLKIGPESRVIMAGNRFSQRVGVTNRSMFECRFIGTPIEDFAKIPEYPYRDRQTFRQRPDRASLYVATDAPYGVKANDNRVDNTQALQAVLDRAGADGGGVVYLPPGKYRLLGHISIPEGVELKGAVDVGSVPLGPGSILEAYEGKGNKNAPPLITMQKRSGLRGIVINYPEQNFDELLRGTGDQAVLDPHVYPYAIRVAGEDAYLVNIGFRATYGGIDLFTHRCDNVYIEYPSGHFFTNGIRIGGGTENAHIRNAQFNTIGYACGDESKFGRWPNARAPGADNQPAYRQNWRDLRFFILDDCRNLFLFNNFHFGSQVGTVFGSERSAPSGLALGHGIDAAIVALEFNKIGKEGFDLIGSQVVSLQKEVEGGGQAARYIKTAPGFDGHVTMFSADFWGSPYYGVELGGGGVHLQLARFNNAGSQRLLEADAGNRGRLRVSGSSVNSPADRTPVNEAGAKQLEAEFSIINLGKQLSADAFGNFNANLSNNPQMLLKDAPDRSGWTATASHGGSATNMIDGDVGTRWGTGRGMLAGDWIVLDMGEPQTFNTVILDQGNSAGDFPGQYEAFVSDDGQMWGNVVVAGEGSQNITVIRFPIEQRKRFVRIVLTQPQPHANRWWSVAEAYVVRIPNESIEYP